MRVQGNTPVLHLLCSSAAPISPPPPLSFLLFLLTLAPHSSRRRLVSCSSTASSRSCCSAACTRSSAPSSRSCAAAAAAAAVGAGAGRSQRCNVCAERRGGGPSLQHEQGKQLQQHIRRPPASQRAPRGQPGTHPAAPPGAACPAARRGSTSPPPGHCTAGAGQYRAGYCRSLYCRLVLPFSQQPLRQSLHHRGRAVHGMKRKGIALKTSKPMFGRLRQGMQVMLVLQATELYCS